MRRLAWFALCCLLAPGPLWGQEGDRPILQMDLAAESAVPGQPIGLRVTLLTPTWFPEPPEFPSFEVPNVMVRLPARGGGPTSQRIGGETWSGVTRSYRLYPMIAGRFRIPPRTVAVTYADLETREPLTVELSTDEIIFAGVIPAETADLDPFIAAESLTLEQSIEGETQDLGPGDVVVRIISARVDGTSPIFIPPLIPSPDGDGLKAYPDEPVVTESDQRGVLTGERTERVTYLAQSGGRFQAPPVSVRWYDLTGGTVEVAEVPGFEVSVAAAIPGGAAVDWRTVLARSIAAIIGIAAVGLAARPLWPRIVTRYRDRRAAYRASEAFAYAQAVRAARRRDFGATLSAVDLWRSRIPVAEGPESRRLTEGLARLGATLYGPAASVGNGRLWSHCLAALRAARRERHQAAASVRTGPALPLLNP